MRATLLAYLLDDVSDDTLSLSTGGHCALCNHGYTPHVIHCCMHANLLIKLCEIWIVARLSNLMKLVNKWTSIDSIYKLTNVCFSLGKELAFPALFPCRRETAGTRFVWVFLVVWFLGLVSAQMRWHFISALARDFISALARDFISALVRDLFSSQK